MTAIRFDAAADRLLRTADLLNYNAAYTLSLWGYLVSDLNAYGTLFALNVNNAAQNMDYFAVGNDGTQMTSYIDTGGTGTEESGSSLTVATWAHLGVIRASATSYQMYLNGATSGPVNARNVAGRTAATRAEIGAFGTSNGDRADMRCAAFKAWSAALSVDELANEGRRYRPFRLDNLYQFTPLIGSAADLVSYDPTLRDWTAAGTLTVEKGPPIPW